MILRSLPTWMGHGLLGAGTALLTRGLRGRLLGTVPAALLASTTAALIAAMLWFVGSGGQDVDILWICLSYGPAWMLVGARLRTPSAQLKSILET